MPSFSKLLEVPVHVEEEVRAPGGHVALDGERAAGPELYDRVVGPDDAGTEVDRARQRRRFPGRIDAKVAVVRWQDDGQVDRDSAGRERNPTESRDRKCPGRTRRERRASRGTG